MFNRIMLSLENDKYIYKLKQDVGGIKGDGISIQSRTWDMLAMECRSAVASDRTLKIASVHKLRNNPAFRMNSIHSQCRLWYTLIPSVSHHVPSITDIGLWLQHNQ